MRTHPRPSIFGRLRGLLLALALLLAPLLGLAATPAQAASGDCTTSGNTATCTFPYTGAAQTWTVPAGVTEVTFDVYGAQGGSGPFSTSIGGNGGRAKISLPVTPGTVYQITVGGRGGSVRFGSDPPGAGGFNGGGSGGSGFLTAGGGGGASDVRTGSFALTDRIIVAGGGGGAPYGFAFGGSGGGSEGGDGRGGKSGDNNGGGKGGSQTAGGDGGIGEVTSDGANGEDGEAGSLGNGGNGGDHVNEGGAGAGGGGGYYGGGGGGGYFGGGGGGGGGSGYGPAGVVFEIGVRSGNGLVTITYTSPDTTTPTASPTQSPAANGAGWNKSDVTVTWNWSDSGSGLDSANCTPSSTSSGEGTLSLSATCADLAGNQGSASYTVKVDKTAPSVTATPDRTPQSSGWYNAPVTLSFSGNDGSGSGVTSCEADKTYSGPDSASASVTGNCTDAAGNVGAASASFQYDATTPTVSYTGNAGTYTIDQSVSITCSAADTLSGIASTTCATITGPAYAFALGTNTRSASATDKAGNTGSGATTFTVGVTFESLCTLSANFSTDPAVDKGLCAKLAAAKAAAASGDTKTKNNNLNAYRQQVAAQSGKAVTNQQATILTNLSKAL